MFLDQLQSDLKDAMKARDEARVSTLRLIISALKNEQIAKKGDLAESDELTVLSKQAKQRKDSIAQYEKGGRDDLVAQESKELEIIQTYLPAQMSDDEVKALVQEKMGALGVTDKSGVGKLMGALMGDLKGKADGAVVKRVVQELLE